MSGRRVLRAPFERRTWAESLQLLLNLPIGVTTFVLTAGLLAVGGGLALTVVGLPIVALAVLGARGLAAMERARAAALLGTRVARPAPRRRGGVPGPVGWVLSALADGPGWRGLLYAVLLLPTGIAGSVVVAMGWSYAAGLLTYPAWRPALGEADQPGLEVGDNRYLDTWPEVAAVSLAGLVLLLLTPWLVRGLAAVNRVLVRALLR
jgi:hypothetical protein